MATQKAKIDIWRKNQMDAIAAISNHPIIGFISNSVSINFDTEHKYVQPKGWVQIGSQGYVWLHPKKRASVEEWTRLLALCMLNLGFGHVMRRNPQEAWELAAMLITDRFCSEMNIGKLPEELLYTPPAIPSGGVESLFAQIVSSALQENNSLTAWYNDFNQGHTLFSVQNLSYRHYDWKKLLAEGIVNGVEDAIALAANKVNEQGATERRTPGQTAKQWIIDNFPLLGAMAAGFDLIEDIRLCQSYDITIAAIDVSAKRIYLNPGVSLSAQELRFILAHELLHAGLNHSSRKRGRDHQLWNVACDFVINSWLIQMQIGTAPGLGLLYDTHYDNHSAEEIYDALATDIRRARRLITLRGNTQPDMIGEETGKTFTSGEDYCKRALMLGLDRCLYNHSTRGLIPAGLIEEIRSLNQPPIPWDVKLAKWFDEHFPALELRRTYARPSRRQTATPDTPRASITKPSEDSRSSRVFGVVLDTSGSMDPALLGKALGSIASYALARDVYAARLICCDAHAYDCGWVEPEQLLYRFSIKGRGGTVLQPGIEMLSLQAKKGGFPIQGPVLIITDAECEPQLDVSMDHAYLIPQGKHLPFIPRGQVFYIS